MLTTYQQRPEVHPGIESVPEYPVTLVVVPAIFERIVLKSTKMLLFELASACQLKNGFGVLVELFSWNRIETAF